MQLKKVVNHGNVRWRVSTYIDGRRKQRFFNSKKLAVEWIKLLRVDENSSNFWSDISTEEQRDIILAYKLAASKGLSVYRCLLQTPARAELKPLSLSEAVLEYQEVIKQRSLRPVSLKATQLFLSQLAYEFGNELVHCVTPGLLEKWFQKRNWKRSTIDGVIAKIGPFFSWLVREGFIDKSPCGAIRRPIRDNSKPPSILSVKAANELLHVAQRRDPEFAKYFAIGIFAGVRPHEIERLDEKDITERYIEITAANAKCRKRRLVNVLPNLKEWLKVSPNTPLKNKRRRKLALIKAAGIRWSHDIMRHSYASYHLAHFCSADKTALEMGHRDTNMLFRHYRQLVTREDAENFWAIMPQL
jgi:integrase/recombinase XerD